MKIGRLFLNYIPQKKCGAELGAAALMSGGSLFGNIVSSGMSSSNAVSQLKAQREENQFNRDWQTAEAEKARVAASQLSYGLQAKQAELQSPVYQRQQLALANINPNVYFGQQSSFTGSSAPSASLPSVGSVGGLSPVSYQPPNLNIGDILSSIGKFKVDDAQSERIKSLLSSEIEMYAQDVESKSLYNKIARIDLFVKRQIKDSQVKKALAEYENVCADTYMKLASGDKEVSQTSLNYSAMKLNDILADKTGQEYQILKNELANWFTMFNAKLENLRSSSEASRASAEESRASAKTENEFRATRGAILGLEYAIKNNEVDISNSTVKSAILSALNKAVQEKWRTKEAYVDYLTKQYKLDTKGVKDAINIITGWIPFAPGISE